MTGYLEAHSPLCEYMLTHIFARGKYRKPERVEHSEYALDLIALRALSRLRRH